MFIIKNTIFNFILIEYKLKIPVDTNNKEHQKGTKSVEEHSTYP